MITKKQETAIFEALGEASMCWSETPKGVFDSNNAKRIGEELIGTLKQEKVSLFDLFKMEAIKGFNYPTAEMCSDGDVCTFLKSIKL